ncbi:MAG: DgaE family pyridoxal phosphate-dependent ammonia lyase [Chloroflexota bacterium]
MNDGIYESFGVSTVINASGKMTNLGGSVLSAGVAEAMRQASQRHVDLDALLARAGALVAEATGSEAAWLTTGAAAGIVLSVASVIAGTDPYRISLLPDASFTSRREILLQAGHQVNFGAPVTQMIRLGGGVPVVVGAVNGTSRTQVASAVGPSTAALLFVQSHHAVQKGAVALADFVAIARDRSVPLIVDAAAEEDLRAYVSTGADLVAYSGGKAIGGPTSGFVAGRRDLIEGVRAQNRGIGRPMKISKEQIAGFLAALREYLAADAEAFARRNQRSARLAEQLRGIPGLSVGLEADEAGRAITRVALRPEPSLGLSARELAEQLAAGSPSIRVRGHQASLGTILLDPRELTPGAEEIIVERVRAIISRTPSAAPR